jgi:hypothetical protein
VRRPPYQSRLRSDRQWKPIRLCINQDIRIGARTLIGQRLFDAELWCKSKGGTPISRSAPVVQNNRNSSSNTEAMPGGTYSPKARR